MPGVTWEVASTSQRERSAASRWWSASSSATSTTPAYPPSTSNIELTLTTPAGASGVPVIIEFFPFEFRGALSAATASRRWQEQVIARGWAYAILSPTSIQADNGAGLTKGIIGLVNKGQPRKPDDWGALQAPGPGARRALLDYLETDAGGGREARGHRRRVALRQGVARDDGLRAALRHRLHRLVGRGRRGAARAATGELLENVAGSGEYHWMAGNYIKYAASADA